MALNMHKKYTESLTRQWAVPAGTQAGVPVVNAVSPTHVGFTLTARGDSTRAAGIPGVTGGTVPNGGVGNAAGGAVVATDGTFRYAVTGVTAGDTGAGGAGTDEGTKVYAVVSAGAVTSLTTTVGSNTFFGIVDDGVIIGTVTPVKIGVVL